MLGREGWSTGGLEFLLPGSGFPKSGTAQGRELDKREARDLQMAEKGSWCQERCILCFF